MFLTRWFANILVFSILIITVPYPGRAQEYRVSLVASSIANPELGQLNAAAAAPVMEGDWVVFRSVTASVVSHIWSWNIKTQRFIKLVDLSMSAPGGTGTFTELNGGMGGPYLKDGMVIFGARDQASLTPPALNIGIYAVPVSGGAIQKVVNYNDAVPGGIGNFFSVGGGISAHTGNMSFSDGVVGFRGEFGGVPIGNSGVYQSDISGGNMKPIADSLHEIGTIFPIKNFTHIAVSSNRAAFIGGNVFAYQALYSTSLPATLPNYNELIRVETVLPGATGGFQFVLPSVRLFKDSVFFIALDSVSGGTNNRRTLYEIPFGGGAPKKVYSNIDSLEGLSSIEQSSVQSYDVSDSHLIFKAKAPGSTNQQGLYLYDRNTGSISRIFRIDQPILDRSFGHIAEVQPGSFAADSSSAVIAISGSALFVGPYTYIILLTKDSSNIVPTPAPTPNVQPDPLTILSTQIRQTLDILRASSANAQKRLPPKPSKSFSKKKRERINNARKAILDARRAIVNHVRTLKELESSSGAMIRTIYPNVTLSNIQLLEKWSKKGSASKTDPKSARKAWQSFTEILNSFG